MLRFLSLLVLIALVSACGPIYKTEYAYVPPHSNVDKMCIAQCVQSKNACEQLCQVKNENCITRAHQDALYQFEIYKREQQRKGEEIKKNLSYFDNSYACRVSCNCKSSFNTCYSACGGQVLERKVCVAFCGKQANGFAAS